MGIKGLLPFLKKATRPANVGEFKGRVVAVDTYCWLHKGAFACAEKLALGENTDQYVQYCMKYVNVLLSFDIKPIMVFDGCRLPSKKEVEKARREQRNANRKKASQLLMEGKMSEARDCLVKCIDVTPEMALNLINACRERGVDCIVAPYEADAQLAYLNKIGIVDLVITEDSDLTLFGCDKILFKMDITGNGQLVERSKIPLAIDLTEDQYTFEKFRRICILSGCDYLANLPGIGLAKATKVFKLSKQTVIKQLIRNIPVLLKMSSLSVPEEYIDNFIKAENTFLYQLVYDPLQRKVVPLNPYPPGIDLACLRYAGPPLSEEMGFQIAIGNININTGEKMANFDPDTFKPKKNDFNIEAILKKSIWSTNSKKISDDKKNLDDEDMKSPSILKRRDKTIKRTGTMGKSMTVIVQNRGRVNSQLNKNDESIIHVKELAKMYSSGKNEVLHVKDEYTEDVVVHTKPSNKNTPPPHSPKDGGDKKNEASPFISPSKMNLFAVQKSEERKSNGKKRFSIDGNSETPKSEKSNCRFFVPSPEPLMQSKFFVQLKQIDSECNKKDDDDDDDDIVDSISDAEMKSYSFNQPKEGSEFRSKLSAFACRYKKSGDLISKGTSMVTHKSSKRNLFSMDDVVDLTIESETGSASKKLRLDALIDRSDMNSNYMEFGREFKGTRRSIFGISRANENAAKRANQAINDLNCNLGDPLCDLTSKELNCSNNSHHIIWQISPSKSSSKSDEDPLSQITCKLTNKKKSVSSLDNDFYEDEKVLSDEGESEDPLQSVQGSVENKMKNKERDNHGSKPSGLRSCGRPKKQQINSSPKQSLLNFFTSNFSLDKKFQQFPSK